MRASEVYRRRAEVAEICARDLRAEEDRRDQLALARDMRLLAEAAEAEERRRATTH